MAESVISDVCNFLKLKHILIPSQNSWLRGCVACFRETNRNHTPNQLNSFVFDQWKLADLNDISAPSLPGNCKTAPKLMLTGKYAIQINYAVNIAEPFYKQLQKIRKPAAEDNLSVDTELDKTAPEISSSRSLELEITDGVVTLLGFEDKLIKKLTEPFVPGVKAVLIGPIECRKGILFLNDQNIDLFGGEVDTLHIKNATENVIARNLNQPENPDPFKVNVSNQNNNTDLDIPEDDVDVFLQIPDEIENGTTGINSSRTSLNSTSLVNSASILESTYKFSTLTQSIQKFQLSNSTASNSLTQYTDNFQDDDTAQNLLLDTSTIELDDDDDEEFALMAAETASLAERTVESATSKQATIDHFFVNGSSSTKNKPNESSTKTIPNKSRKIASRDEKNCISSESARLKSQMAKSDSNGVDNQFETGSYTSIFKNESKIKIDPCTSKKSSDVNVNSNNKNDENVSIDQSKQGNSKTSDMLTFPPKKYPCTQIVRGSVVNISQKLCINENKWCLSAVMNMHGVELDVDFSAQSLDKLFGMTADELQSKRREVKENPELKNKINEIIKTSQRKIQRLDSNIKIHFASYITKPVILQILD